MTKTEFDDEILRITQDHIEVADEKFAFMETIMKDGFHEPEVANIISGVRDALALANKQLARFGKPAPENAS